MADFGAKSFGWPDGGKISAFNPDNYNVGYRGRISCDTADKWEQILEGNKPCYLWPFNDCEDFAKAAICKMLGDCP